MADGIVNYRFLSVVGEGGFGRVYRARLETGEGFQRQVAIKVLFDENPPKSLITRFQDEAKILGLIRDRAIVGVEPPVQIGGRWAVVMEFVDGASCGALLSNGPIPPGVALEIVMEIARALHNAYHMEGDEGQPLKLLHRDIKPDNIQITPAGEVRLLDFGIAKAEFAARSFHTRASFGGTPGYIAPERPKGIELPAGDVYSLGVVLHELVTASRPRYTPTVHLDGEASALATELDVHPTLLQDPAIAETLRLAGWMRAEEPEDRPTPRQVEEACRNLRNTLPPPYLRDWAEQQVPHRIELAPDEMVGRILSTTVSTVLTGVNPAAPTQISLPPTIPAMSTMPVIGRPEPDRRLALGALLGGSAALVGLLGVAAVALAVLGVYLVVARPNESVAPTPDPVVTAPVPDAEPASVTGDDGEDDGAVDAAAPDPVPAPDGPVRDPGSEVPVAPRPTPPAPKPEPAVVTVVEPIPIPTQPVPVPVVAAPTAPKRPTGRVIVRTIPSGARVLEGGAPLTAAGLGYELTVGRHMLVFEAPNGERSTTTPVVVTANDTVEICYNFDTNQACSVSSAP